jgi:hypothetical protein
MFGTVMWALFAIAIGVVVIKLGLGMLRSLATPVPPPPPSGEMRKVKITYRCSLCGTEVRMTRATDEHPEAPRHCMEDMDLVVPAE